MEYTPWNQTFFYHATLTAAACAFQDLQAIEGNRKYQNTIDLYTRIVRTAMLLLQRENDCCIKEGKPYFLHMHTPLRNGENFFMMGHPIFGAEDLPHSGSGALNLPYIWEAGPEFGCSTALVAGYANVAVFTLNDPTTKNKRGQPRPRNHLHSSWTLAAKQSKDSPARRLGAKDYSMLPFAPDLLKTNLRWTSRQRPGAKFRLLYAGVLYRDWKKRTAQRRLVRYASGPKNTG